MSAPAVRSLIAREFLGETHSPYHLCAITLHPHQRDAVARLRTVMREHGGALLADEVGLGKTYVAVTLIRECSRALVVAPASLRTMWTGALRAAGAIADIASYHELSRGHVPEGKFDLVVLDEAHHARNPATLRFRRLAAVTAGARVLLLSATPIHNRHADLAAPLALFLGARAFTLGVRGLSAFVIRRERADVAASAPLPEAGRARWLSVQEDQGLLDGILALPPPVPPRDGGDGGALLTISLVRQWASSRAALAGALRRRIARAAALASALEAGRFPSRHELASWTFAEDALQLAFPELLAPPHEESAALLPAVRAHSQALGALLREAGSAPGADASRAERLRELRRAHDGEKLVAFAHYAETVQVLFGHLRADGGVAALTARGGLIATGALTRRQTLERFAPLGSGVPPPPPVERIDALLTTDLVSEGVNLQDASVVVHLDLPWSPARLEQRVGRSRRIGSPHVLTNVYALAPPGAADSLLGLERRLRDKLRIAARSFGVAGSIVPPFSLAPDFAEPGESQLAERVRQRLSAWIAGGNGRPQSGWPHSAGDATSAVPPSCVAMAAVRASRSGFLALLRRTCKPILIASLDEGAPTDDPAHVLEALAEAGDEECVLADERRRAALRMVESWLELSSARSAAGGAVPIAAGARVTALRRISAIASRAPPHRRHELATLAVPARAAVTAPYGLGAEQMLAELVAAELADDAWLRALCAFGQLHAARNGQASDDAHEVVAIIVLAG